MTIQEISETMSDNEGEALQAFQACAAAFDKFNKGAAQVVRSLLVKIEAQAGEIERLNDIIGNRLIGDTTDD